MHLFNLPSSSFFLIWPTLSLHLSSLSSQESKRDESSKKQGEEDKKAPLPPVPMSRLFYFADRIDIFLMVIGGFAAAGCGVIMPLFALIFSDTINAINFGTDDEKRENANRYAMYFVGLACISCTYYYTHFMYIYVASSNQSTSVTHLSFRLYLPFDIITHSGLEFLTKLMFRHCGRASSEENEREILVLSLETEYCLVWFEQYRGAIYSHQRVSYSGITLYPLTLCMPRKFMMCPRSVSLTLTSSPPRMMEKQRYLGSSTRYWRKDRLSYPVLFYLCLWLLYRLFQVSQWANHVQMVKHSLPLIMLCYFVYQGLEACFGDDVGCALVRH